MIDKCANPECSRPFLYFREGKLFSLELDEVGRERCVDGISAFGSQRYKTEFFWLCGDCCRHLTLHCQRSNGTARAILQPLVSSPKRYFRQNYKEKVYEAA